MTVNVLTALFAGTPLSVTVVVMMLVCPICASVGVQVMTPVSGLMIINVGPGQTVGDCINQCLRGNVPVLRRVGDGEHGQRS